MATTNNEGVVINLQNYQAHDQIVTILTSQNILTLIALGVRKLTSKNRLALALGNIVEVEYFKARLVNRLSKLKKATLLYQAPINQGDTALVLHEIIKLMPKNEVKTDLLFKACLESFPFFGSDYNHHIKVYVLTRLLDAYGFWPEWDKCIECQSKKRIIGFEFYQGGFTCVRHAKKARELNYLYAFQALGANFSRYKSVEAEINFQIYQELIDFCYQQKIIFASPFFNNKL